MLFIPCKDKNIYGDNEINRPFVAFLNAVEILWTVDGFHKSDQLEKVSKKFILIYFRIKVYDMYVLIL